ncbi:hypothetical protein F383_03428 [Gossypium arboreum]|uniref:Uncharacterized protein n=1 Tax=Gossypium arboreum TaxID=29729 RepID=A0A0B0PED6_GOSAR|nr:hypothetical protein F383_03428 [Gossypium arboreum]
MIDQGNQDLGLNRENTSFRLKS